jgi:3'-phosphoadenosine 5'-phosphosulfate (PAPS) 3'-phosphatase
MTCTWAPTRFGDSAFTIHNSQLREWDTCAPEAILTAAGGTVTDCRGEPLRYNKPDPRQPHGIMACAPGVFEVAMGEWGKIYEL